MSSELTIGQLSERGGVPTSALRFYERQGLVHSGRTAGNQRRYHRATLRRIAFIRASQSVGIPLALIGEVLGFLPGGHPAGARDGDNLAVRDQLGELLPPGAASTSSTARRVGESGTDGPDASAVLSCERPARADEPRPRPLVDPLSC